MYLVCFFAREGCFMFGAHGCLFFLFKGYIKKFSDCIGTRHIKSGYNFTEQVT